MYDTGEKIFVSLCVLCGISAFIYICYLTHESVNKRKEFCKVNGESLVSTQQDFIICGRGDTLHKYMDYDIDEWYDAK